MMNPAYIKEKSTLIRKENLSNSRIQADEKFTICLTNNYAFRKTFKNKYVLKGFLMALLNLSEDDILDLEVSDPYEEGDTPQEKEGILDIKVHMNHSRKLNIEMQNKAQDYWSERTIFYNCKMYTENFKHGMDYNLLEPCIHVGILNFNHMKSPGFHHKILLSDVDSHEIYSSNFLFHVIELRKLDNVSAETSAQELYHWARLLAATSWEEVFMESNGNPYREAAREEMEKICLTENERYLYLREALAASDATTQYNSAMRKGREEGKIQERHKNLLATISVFKNMNMPEEEILHNLITFYECTPDEAACVYKEFSSKNNMVL